MAYRHRVRAPRLQARIFLPDWFVKVVRPGKEIANDTVQLHVPLDMGKVDIKNYMEKIYNVPVAKVHTRIQIGKWKYSEYRNDLIHQKTADVKVAYVMLKEGTFDFPQMFPDMNLREVKEDAENKPPTNPLLHSSKWFN